jgi:hypothetical protein
MTSPQPSASRRRIVSILWFPVFFAIALPLAFLAAFHQPQPHNAPIGVVGDASQVSRITAELHHVSAGGFEVRQFPSVPAAAAAVRGQQFDAAYAVNGTASILYVARAASGTRPSYLQGVFASIAAEAGGAPPQTVDLVPLETGDGSTGIFFVVFSLMMSGIIAAMALQQLPMWGIGRRAVTVAVVGAIGAVATYLTAVGLNVLPDKPLLLVYEFLLTQVFAQLMVGAAPLLKQYFLAFALTFALIFNVSSNGGTVATDMQPTLFRYLSDAMPLAQAVKITRSVSYFHDADITQPTLLMLLWAAVAGGTVAAAWLRQSGKRLPRRRVGFAVSPEPSNG